MTHENLTRARDQLSDAERHTRQLDVDLSELQRLVAAVDHAEARAAMENIVSCLDSVRDAQRAMERALAALVRETATISLR